VENGGYFIIGDVLVYMKILLLR